MEKIQGLTEACHRSQPQTVSAGQITLASHQVEFLTDIFNLFIQVIT